MPYLAGIDEAGLGPLLGPLVTGFALFELNDDAPLGELASLDLWQRFAPFFAKERGKHGLVPGAKLAVADSKQLYSPSRGIGALEDSVLALSAAASQKPVARDFAGYWDSVSIVPRKELGAYPWYADHALALPRAAMADKLDIVSRQAQAHMESRGARLRSLGALPVLEGELNRLFDTHNNKADAHCACVCAVIARLWKQAGQLAVVCDHLGARVRYADALKIHLKPDSIEMLEERETSSAYRLKRGGHEMHIAFRVKGDDSSFPAALASMTAKYTRELCMELFNGWFCARQPGLKPTKGYVTDGRRFLDDTADLRAKHGVDAAMLVRKR